MIRDLFNQQDIFIGVLYIVYMYLCIDHSMYEDIYVCLRRYTIET